MVCILYDTCFVFMERLERDVWKECGGVTCLADRNQCTWVCTMLLCVMHWRTLKCGGAKGYSYPLYKVMQTCWFGAECVLSATHSMCGWALGDNNVLPKEISLSAFSGTLAHFRVTFISVREREKGGCNNHPLWEWLVMVVDNVLIIICLRTNLTSRRQCYRLWSSIYLYVTEYGPYDWSCLFSMHLWCNRLY